MCFDGKEVFKLLKDREEQEPYVLWHALRYAFLIFKNWIKKNVKN